MLDFLFDNIGGKIMSFAKALFVIEAIGALLFGLITCCYFERRYGPICGKGAKALFQNETELLF